MHICVTLIKVYTLYVCLHKCTHSFVCLCKREVPQPQTVTAFLLLPYSNSSNGVH